MEQEQNNIQPIKAEPTESSLDFPTITDTRKRAMLFALKKTLGIVSQAAKEVGINRDTHYSWMASDKNYKLAVRLIAESAVDFAESKLFELINGISVRSPDGKAVYLLPPNTAATIFFLKTRAKHRGYVERYQLENIMGEDDEVETTLDI